MNRFRNGECGMRNGEGGNRDAAYGRRILEYGLLILASMMLLGSITTAHAMSGREVYEKVHEVAKKTLDHKLEATMILFDKGGGTRSRILVAYGRKADGEAYKVLVLFKTPPDLKDVGFLVHARTFADRDLWAYFPEFKKIRRIPTSSQDDSFFGTDFSYDDFGGPANLDDYSFKILREEIMDGKPCYVMEVIPKIRRKYTRYVSWVAKDLWIHLRIEYYQDKDLYRAGTFIDVRMIDDIPTAFKGLMANMKTGHKTEFTLEDVQYHTAFPDDLFTQRSLERAGK
jgi:outer membrane lipoprotein-sorting protein